MPTLSAHSVAVELRHRLPGVGVKKLHKLLYYCQGHHLATFGLPLFSESISAWDMGPGCRHTLVPGKGTLLRYLQRTSG